MPSAKAGEAAAPEATEAATPGPQPHSEHADARLHAAACRSFVVTCAGTVEVAEAAAELTAGGKIITVAGGGDTVAALRTE